MQKLSWLPFFPRILFLAGLFCLIFPGVLLFPIQETLASQSSCDGDEDIYQELFSDRTISANEYRQDCNKLGHASDTGRNSVRSAVSKRPEGMFLSFNGDAFRSMSFFYVGTNREFLKKANYRRLFNSSRDTLLSNGPPVIPLLAINGTLHPGATQMGLSLMSLLHMPFFQSGRFGLGQR